MLNYANTGGGESDTHREKKTQDALDWKGMTVMMVCVCVVVVVGICGFA